MVLNGRTDMASESYSFHNAGVSVLEGANFKDEQLEGFDVSCVEIISESAVAALQKPKGKYYTLSLDGHFERGSQRFPAAASALAELIRRCVGKPVKSSVLIAALGNPDVSPDALGSLAASSILVTRHLKESSPQQFSGFTSTSLCRTGVLGTTGIESSAQIKNLCASLRPELVIVIDALAGADASRLCKSIQICDSGIAPGSGVGNSRQPLSRAVLGVPVLAIGSPTVIDAASLSGAADLGKMFVTPRDIDSLVRSLARVIAYGVNLALHEGLTVSDVDMLVG